MALTLRGTALARTFAATFAALVEHAKQHPAEAQQLADTVAAHLRAAFPTSLVALPDPALAPVPLIALPVHIDTKDGSIDLTRGEDGRLSLLVSEVTGHDAVVTPTEAQLALLVEAVRKEAA